MKKTFDLDAKLLKHAKEASGAATYQDAVRLALQAMVHHHASQALRKFIGSEPDAQDVPRRREEPDPKREKPAARRRVA
jgi:hypothetical protein